MQLTTLCYLIRDGKWLMLHRTKKENDENAGKWIGVGGKFEDGESPDDCVKREVFEETALSLNSFKFRGIVTFISDIWEDSLMFLYTSDDFTGELKECDEGTLKWIDETDVKNLRLWEGDKIFIDLLLEDHPFFSLKLCYEGDDLVSAVLDGNEIM